MDLSNYLVRLLRRIISNSLLGTPLFILISHFFIRFIGDLCRLLFIFLLFVVCCGDILDTLKVEHRKIVSTEQIFLTCNLEKKIKKCLICPLFAISACFARYTNLRNSSKETLMNLFHKLFFFSFY